MSVDWDELDRLYSDAESLSGMERQGARLKFIVAIFRDYPAISAQMRGNLSERYQVYKGSVSAHCCFDSTVIDLTKPEIINGKHYVDGDGRLSYESICECFSTEDAETICRALNATPAPPQTP